MSDTALRMQPFVRERLARHRADWSAVWGGAFTFAAIWLVFESLALAIFGTGLMGAGMAVWTIVLTIIAMYVAGFETARLAGISTRRDGITYGLMMFGLAAMSAIVVMLVSIFTMNGVHASVPSTLATGISSGTAWTAFLVLFLGWLAAMGGTSTGIEHKSATLKQVESERPAVRDTSSPAAESFLRIARYRSSAEWVFVPYSHSACSSHRGV